eukprot:773248-Amphidinium_carterae.1
MVSPSLQSISVKQVEDGNMLNCLWSKKQPWLVVGFLTGSLSVPHSDRDRVLTRIEYSQRQQSAMALLLHGKRRPPTATTPLAQSLPTRKQQLRQTSAGAEALRVGPQRQSIMSSSDSLEPAALDPLNAVASVPGHASRQFDQR